MRGKETLQIYPSTLIPTAAMPIKPMPALAVIKGLTYGTKLTLQFGSVLILMPKVNLKSRPKCTGIKPIKNYALNKVYENPFLKFSLKFLHNYLL